jgi:ATP-binding protein involved in chromosome partitioning
MRMPVLKEAILEALKQVVDPDLHRDIVTLGFVKEIKECDGNVAATIELTTPACPVKDILKQQAIDAIKSVPGVVNVAVEMTAQVRNRPLAPEDMLPGVKHCIAVASGKGGVGKSTVSVNMAIALAKSGAKVGLLDADVYGPSIPLMMGCANERPDSDGEKILPIVKHGITMMSIGFLLEDGQAVMWRGPMVAATVRQLLADVAWGELDYLIVDLPPGTGDAPMSLAQLAPLTGVVIVATPDHIAAEIASKSILLFERLNAPIMGVVENMAGFVCPCCGTETRIFKGLSGEELAGHFGVPFLGSVPLDPKVSEAGDEGVPSLIANPDGPQAKSFHQIAGKIAAQASIMTHR